MKRFLLVILLFLPILAMAQNVRYDIEESVTTSEHKDREACSRVGKVEVYVIQVASLSGENSGTKAQTTVKSINAFLAEHGINAEAYTVFMEPNHKVRIGNFSTRHAAYGVLAKIHSTYTGAFVTKDKRRIADVLEE